MLKVYKKIFLIIFSCCVLGELIMRWCGFCDAPLYYNDPYCGYNLVSNQQLTRFGNKYITNEYGMRSDRLKDKEYRILLVGDSVLNGGGRLIKASSLHRCLMKNIDKIILEC